MNKVTIILLSVLLIQSSAIFHQQFHGSKYQRQTASKKYHDNMKKLQEHTDHGEYYTLRMPQLFIQDNNKAFDVTSDEMPEEGPLNTLTRPKLIHTVGVTAGITFESTGDHPYTGIFKGVDFGICRFSAAQKPGSGGLATGFTFKFFRDYTPSANIISMYSLLGQGNNSNPFAHDQTNHVPFPNRKTIDVGKKLLLDNFLKVSDYPTMIGLSDSAEFDRLGYSELDPRFPFRLVFHPTKEVHEAIPSTINMVKTPLFYIDYMDGLFFDTLFEVYAQATPEQDEQDLQKIGVIKMKTKFQPSKYGDEHLFYQHTRMEEDMRYHPEWDIPAHEIMDREGNVDPVFNRPDLPFN